MKKLLILTASSVCILASTAAIATSHTTADKKVKAAKKHAAMKKKHAAKTHKSIYHPAMSDVKHPTMKNPGKVRHLGSFINMGPQSRIQINGFMSAGVSGITAKPGNYRTINLLGPAVSGGPVVYDRGYVFPNRGLVQNKVGFGANSLVGLQFTGNITSSLSAVFQFVSNGSEVEGHEPYSIQTQWAFVRYRPNNKWQVRAGRMRTPVFAYSDTQEIAYTYPWVFLPNTVYRILPFTNFNGADVVFSQAIGKGDWLLRIHPFYGSNQSKFETVTKGFTTAGTACNEGVESNCAPTQIKFTENGLGGASLAIGNEKIQFRGSYVHASLDGSSQVPTLGYTTRALAGENAYFYSLGLKVAFDWFRFQGEFASRHADKAKNNDANIANLNGFYTMVGAQLGRWFPNLTYGALTTTNTGTLNNVNNAGGVPGLNTNESPQAEDEWTLGVAYTINGNIVAKASATRIKPKDGTWGLYNFNPGTKANYLYAASIDAIF